MALFSKPPIKKVSGKPEGNVRLLTVSGRSSARQLVNGAHGKVRSGDHPRRSAAVAKVLAVAQQEPAIEVATSNPGLCAVLENAALAFASGHPAAARELLEHGIENDAEAHASQLAWQALLDVLQRVNDRAAFERVAMQYVVLFECSAPAWRDVTPREAARRGTSMAGIAMPHGRITAGNATQLLGWSRLKAEAGAPPHVDLLHVTGFDDAGARLLADALAGLRRRRTPVLLMHVDKLRTELDATVDRGAAAGEGPWLLLLEILQWQGEQATFDDRAVEYAVLFEVSPPSWEPPALDAAAGPALAGAPTPASENADGDDTLAWSGDITGASPDALSRLFDFAESRSCVLVDLHDVTRIEFASAGALMNAINRLGHQGRTVRIARASAILQSLLFLLGLTPEQLAGRPA